MARVLHIIDTLSGAGPTRSLQASVEYLAAVGQRHEHAVVTLRRPSYPPALLRARKAGLAIYQAPGNPELDALIVAADLVQLHYWNNPAFLSFLRRASPAHRRLAWFKVLGRHAPQVISPTLLQAFDAVMLSSELSLGLPALRGAAHLAGMVEVVPGLMEPGRLEGLRPRPHDGFVVSYIGTVNPAKMHAGFVPMSAAAEVPGIRFVVCGTGDCTALQSEAAGMGRGDRFEFRGYVENIRPVLEISDAFGYPLCEDTWATSEKSLQEAMLAGVPPVVFPHGGIPGIVRHGETGIVVQSPAEYSRALEYLHRHPEERRRLGDNARAFVREHFDGRRVAARIHSLYERLLTQPRRVHPPAGPGVGMAALYARFMLPAHSEFGESLDASDPAPALRADRAIAAASTTMSQGEGGIVQFRNAWPDDPGFLFWSGLVQAGRQRWPQALAEFRRARASAPTHWRLAWYSAVAAQRDERPDLAAPLFAEARALAARAGLSEAWDASLATQAAAAQPPLFPVPP